MLETVGTSNTNKAKCITKLSCTLEQQEPRKKDDGKHMRATKIGRNPKKERIARNRKVRLSCPF